MFLALVQFIAFVLLIIFASKFKDGKIEDSDAYPEDVDSMKVSFRLKKNKKNFILLNSQHFVFYFFISFQGKYMTAMLIFGIAGAIVHLGAAGGLFFEHLYITAGVALLEVGTIVGALLEAIMIHNIFWIAFGLALFSLAMLALHIFDLLAIQNIHPDAYQKPHRSSPPTADAEDSE